MSHDQTPDPQSGSGPVPFPNSPAGGAHSMPYPPTPPYSPEHSPEDSAASGARSGAQPGMPPYTGAPAAPRALITDQIAEREAWHIGNIGSYILATVLTVLIVLNITIFAFTSFASGPSPIAVILVIILAVACTGFKIIQPGHTRVLVFMGKYVDTVRDTGLVWVNPFVTSRKKMSVRVRNFETNELKINDLDGNPVTTAAIVVWTVSDTARASFAVENYEEFIYAQAESALRHVISGHPYDEGNRHDVISLRGSTENVSQELADEVSARVAAAGIQVVEARISSLAYAPEIAQAMLQRQQASAVVAARERIVEGAVSMVEDALNQLEQQNIVDLDDERRAAMVSNLLVVLCSESNVNPVVNAGSLYN